MRRRGRRSVAAPQEENRCGEVSEMEERFFCAADSDGCWEGSSGWDGRVDALGDAFGCLEDVAKGLG